MKKNEIKLFIIVFFKMCIMFVKGLFEVKFWGNILLWNL